MTNDARPLATAKAELMTASDAEPIPYSRVLQVLEQSGFLWLSTTRPTGHAPHVRPILAVVVDGLLYSTSNRGARKAKNLDINPRSALSARDDDMDVVFEATAQHVDDVATLERVARAYDKKYGWPVTIQDGAYDAPYGAPTAGPPPYHLFRFTPTAVFAFGTNDTYAPRSTRFTFTTVE